MSDPLAWLALTAASLGVLHTILGPDHYLPFVLMGRAGRWSRAKTLGVTLACGLGHVLSSVVLGAVGIALGVAVGRLEALDSFRGQVAAWALIAFGLVYFVWGLRRAARQRPHAHVHAHADGTIHVHAHVHESEHLHVHTADPQGLPASPEFGQGGISALLPRFIGATSLRKARGKNCLGAVNGGAPFDRLRVYASLRQAPPRQKAVASSALAAQAFRPDVASRSIAPALAAEGKRSTSSGAEAPPHQNRFRSPVTLTPWVLFTVFVFGPCEPLIPLLLYPAAQQSPGGVVVVAVVFGLATLATMVVAVLVCQLGVERLPLGKLEPYTHALAGAALLLCGGAIQFLRL